MTGLVVTCTIGELAAAVVAGWVPFCLFLKLILACASAFAISINLVAKRASLLCTASIARTSSSKMPSRNWLTKSSKAACRDSAGSAERSSLNSAGFKRSTDPWLGSGFDWAYERVAKERRGAKRRMFRREGMLKAEKPSSDAS
ncbi:hypothetical protein LTR28_008954, partial [Elasticomyces elasticus]